MSETVTVCTVDELPEGSMLGRGRRPQGRRVQLRGGNPYVPVRTFEARVEGGEVRLEIGS